MADYSFTNIDQSATDGSDFLAGLPAHNESTTLTDGNF